GRLGLGLAARTGATAAAAVELGKHVEGIGSAVEVGSGRALAFAAAAIGAHLPGRAVAGQRVLLIARHGFGVHAGEEIVGLVILADVVEAEVEVLARVLAALRRAMRPPALAARPLALGGFLARLRLLLRTQLVRLDANAVEEFR